MQAVRKKPNMIWDVIRRTERIVTISEGRAMVAPERSSDMRMATGLNQ